MRFLHGISDDCGCGELPAQERFKRNFIWAGCSDNVKYANSFVKEIMEKFDSISGNDARYILVHFHLFCPSFYNLFLFAFDLLKSSIVF